MLEQLGNDDSVITFNYDLVAERALRKSCEKQRKNFGAWLYGLRRKLSDPRGPVLLKLHGSSNWEFLDSGKFKPRTESWGDFDEAPGYRFAGEGTNFSIFLPFWDKRIERWQRSRLEIRPVGGFP